MNQNTRMHYNYRFLILALIITFQAKAQKVGSTVYVLSHCANGGFDYYFFSDSTFLAECNDGCEYRPFVKFGHWNVENTELIGFVDRTWMGKGIGESCGPNCGYESYTAVLDSLQSQEKFDLSEFEKTKSGKPNSCGVWTFNEQEKSKDPHFYLKMGNVKRKYSQTSERLLQKSDLAAISKKERKLMSQEILAAYGYRFRNKKTAKYFKELGYFAVMENVEAFLSEIERKNMELIKKYGIRKIP